MIERINDGALITIVLRDYEEIVGEDFNAYEWADRPENIALASEDNLGLFEFEYPGLFTGHYFFGSARGSDAADLAKAMLDEMYAGYGAKVIRGLTPSDKRAAALLTRWLGFTSYGMVNTVMGPCELFMLTADEFYAKNPALRPTNKKVKE